MESGRLKKLFRTSRPAGDHPTVLDQVTQGAMPVMTGGGGGGGGREGGKNQLKTTRTDKSITPFPMDMGMRAPASAPPPPVPAMSSRRTERQQSQKQQQQQQQSQPPQLQKPLPQSQSQHLAAPRDAPPRDKREPSRERDHRPSTVGGPKLADLRKMEEETAASVPFRRDRPGSDRTSFQGPGPRSRAGTSSDRTSFQGPGPRSRAGTGSSTDGWPSGISPSSAPQLRVLSGAGEPTYAPSPSQSQQQGSGPQQQQAQSPVTQPAFYLPPGAGPPSPQFRPATPTRLGHMQQSSLGNVQQLPPPVTAGPGAGGSGSAVSGGPAFGEGMDGYNRSRTYSATSLSARGSDYEGSVHHLVTSPMTSMLNKLQAPLPSTRSPLVNSFSEPPHPQSSAPIAAMYGTTYSARANNSTSMLPERNTPTPQQPDDRAPAERADGHNHTRSSHEKDKPDKAEKKRFWGGWGKDKKHKEPAAPPPPNAKDIPVSAPVQVGVTPVAAPTNDGDSVLHQSLHHQSIDEWREGASANGHPPSSQGHGGVEDPTARKPRGLEIITRDETNDVATAIRNLCSSRDTLHGAVLDLCDKVNRSQGRDIVAKEAARSIRKVLKSSPDSDRRMAVRVWWITMRNIEASNYPHYASNKKFMSAVEPIFTMQMTPPVSNSTYRTAYDVLSDLTFRFGKERGCDGLHDVWVKVKSAADPDYGNPLPDDFLKHCQSSNQIPPPPLAPPANVVGLSPLPAPPSSLPSSRRPSEPVNLPLTHHMKSLPTPEAVGFGGPGYADLPDHNEDMRRLTDDCNAAKEAARVLQEALVFTRPEELNVSNSVIREFYTKCVLAHESLTNQIDWAQSEAAKSQPANNNAADGQRHSTVEEKALDLLLEALGACRDALKQHDDLEKLAADEREIRAVQERSKKDTRMDRRQQMDMLTAGEGGSSSRSPSPSGYARLPGGNDSQGSGATHTTDRHLPEVPAVELMSNHLQAALHEHATSRTPSPDGRRSAHQLPSLPIPPPKMSSPPRSGSPLGRTRMQGPRPLPNPFRSANSSQSLAAAAAEAHPLPPSRGHSGSNYSGTGEDEDDEHRPSRKALGKRRAVAPDPDNTFDPNDMFGTTTKSKSDSASERSITADDLYFAKDVKYAYDAWAESEATRKERDAADKSAATAAALNDRARIAAITGVGGAGGGLKAPTPITTTSPGSAVLGPRDPHGATPTQSPIGMAGPDPVVAAW